VHPIDQLDYIRYSWTVSNKKIKQELGFTPARTSAQAVLDFAIARGVRSKFNEIANREFDDFGMDKDYVARLGRTLFNVLDRYYWRIEIDGLERVPREGRAVLVGIHRAFMPWDGILIVDLLLKKVGRCPRFLMHPGLAKPPFVSDFMAKIGAVIACQENADHVLARDEILGVFPEGINGAFTLYRDAYRLGRFGRDDFVKMALRNGAPIVPFVFSRRSTGDGGSGLRIGPVCLSRRRFRCCRCRCRPSGTLSFSRSSTSRTSTGLRQPTIRLLCEPSAER
jgi:hypothetical protein